MKLAVVGATGMVGTVMLDVLKERKFQYDELLLVASKKSVGKLIDYCGEKYSLIDVEMAIEKKPDIAIFSAGGDTSLKWAPKFAEIGTIVIDNSSAWRMDPSKKLIIPEINGDLISKEDKIIANPNCSTIQMLMALSPIHNKFGIKRVIVSTYQSITGTGVKAVQQLENEYNNIEGEMAYNYQIHQNAIPQCDDFLDNGYTKEEMKLSNETNKILDPNIKVSATAVRIPVMGGHSESVNLELNKSFDVGEITSLLTDTEGVTVKDDISNFEYPMPFYSKNQDEVFVGRIRKDFSQENSLNMWIVADNLRKGAATNAVQIAEKITKDFF
ncbi:MAG: aspartate-semialdehyde dehydrogenase [Flavobacteriaceae bacterium]|jgi:aspartate-semialdehyde dehydrogenase|nr:aspartate-semialdehyde dehydrogenase [Flavobacteriaceae bacterium]RZP07230.1 MAG: aspartate-semialdehyde dehydrogenase [Flavobacteriales bacterium]